MRMDENPSATTNVALNVGCSIGSATLLLGVTFVVLKLAEVLTWRWGWVLLPFYPVGLSTIAISGLAMVKGALEVVRNDIPCLEFVDGKVNDLTPKKAYA